MAVARGNSLYITVGLQLVRQAGAMNRAPTSLTTGIRFHFLAAAGEKSKLRQNRFHHAGRLDTGELRVEALVSVGETFVVDAE